GGGAEKVEKAASVGVLLPRGERGSRGRAAAPPCSIKQLVLADGAAGESGVRQDVRDVDERVEALPLHRREVGEEDVADAHQDESREQPRPDLPYFPAPEPDGDAEEDGDGNETRADEHRRRSTEEQHRV